MDVELQREDGVWDILARRFADAAARGDFVDLTDERSEGKPLFISLEKAKEAYPRSQFEFSSSTPRASAADCEPWKTPILKAIKEALLRLITVRTQLSKRLDATQPITARIAREISRGVLGLNRYLRTRVQSAVNKQADRVVEDDELLAQLEILNTIVHKANILIKEYNVPLLRGSLAGAPSDEIEQEDNDEECEQTGGSSGTSSNGRRRSSSSGRSCSQSAKIEHSRCVKRERQSKLGPISKKTEQNNARAARAAKRGCGSVKYEIEAARIFNFNSVKQEAAIKQEESVI